MGEESRSPSFRCESLQLAAYLGLTVTNSQTGKKGMGVGESRDGRITYHAGLYQDIEICRDAK